MPAVQETEAAAKEMVDRIRQKMQARRYRFIAYGKTFINRHTIALCDFHYDGIRWRTEDGEYKPSDDNIQKVGAIPGVRVKMEILPE